MLFTGLQGIAVALPWMLWAVGGIFHHLVGSQGPSRTVRGPQTTPRFALCTPRYLGHVWGEGLGQRKQCWEMGFAQSEGLPADIPQTILSPTAHVTAPLVGSKALRLCLGVPPKPYVRLSVCSQALCTSCSMPPNFPCGFLPSQSFPGDFWCAPGSLFSFLYAPKSPLFALSSPDVLFSFIAPQSSPSVLLSL